MTPKEQLAAARRFTGKKSKAQGDYFEALIEAGCNFYRDRKVADIEKTPEPMRPIKDLGGDVYKRQVVVLPGQVIPALDVGRPGPLGKVIQPLDDFLLGHLFHVVSSCHFMSASPRNSSTPVSYTHLLALWIFSPTVTKYGSKAATWIPAFRSVRVLFSFPAPKSTTLEP